MFRLLSKSVRSIVLVAILPLSLITVSFEDTKALTPQDVVGETTRQIVEGRELVRGYATDVKGKYKPTTPEYAEAKRKYRLAMSKYNGWAASVKRAIRLGKTRNLQNDASYKAAATQATAAAKSFIDYA